MKHTLLHSIVLSLVAAGTVFGQTREAYRQAYNDWRQSDSNLERDAATAAEALGARTEKAVAGATKFVAARRAFYEAKRTQLAEQLTTLQPVEFEGEKEDIAATQAYLSGQERAAANSIQAFGGDPDRSIQQLRQALEKEHTALMALKSAVESRGAARDAAKEANQKATLATDDATQQMKAVVASFEQSAQNAGELAEAWPVYYRTLANGARGVWTGDTAPGPSSGTAAPATSGIQASRYTGSWIFSFGVSTYRGPSPFSVDVFVREVNGQIFGTVNARFIVNGNGDPEVRFAFSGPVQSGRRQAFPLQTAEGATGTIELIPGSALNLLDVNYSINGAPGKVHEAGVTLVKR